MSGSGGGGGGGDIGFAPVDSGASCADLKFDTTLTSVDDSVLATVVVGDELDVALASSNGAQSIQVQTASGDVLGAIVDSVPELLRCIQEGTQYKARVSDINGGSVRVEVSAR